MIEDSLHDDETRERRLVAMLNGTAKTDLDFLRAADPGLGNQLGVLTAHALLRELPIERVDRSEAIE